jgi:hypothetical protein
MSYDFVTRHCLINQTDFSICSYETKCKNAIMMAVPTTRSTELKVVRLSNVIG